MKKNMEEELGDILKSYVGRKVNTFASDAIEIIEKAYLCDEQGILRFRFISGNDSAACLCFAYHE